MVHSTGIQLFLLTVRIAPEKCGNKYFEIINYKQYCLLTPLQTFARRIFVCLDTLRHTVPPHGVTQYVLYTIEVSRNCLRRHIIAK